MTCTPNPCSTTPIQGDILPGLLERNELLLFFRIDSAADFLPFLKALPLTSMQTVLDQRAEVARLTDPGSHRC